MIASYILRSQIAFYLRSFSFIGLSSVMIARFTITRFYDDVLVDFRISHCTSIVILIFRSVTFIRISGYPDLRDPADDPGNIRVPGLPGSGYPENANTSGDARTGP